MVHRSNVDRRYTDCFSVVAIRVSLWNFLLRLYACRISRMACPSEVQVGYSHDVSNGFYSAFVGCTVHRKRWKMSGIISKQFQWLKYGRNVVYTRLLLVLPITPLWEFLRNDAVFVITKMVRVVRHLWAGLGLASSE